MNKPIRIVGIGGVSQSGKSSFAKSLAENIQRSGKCVSVFDMDEFVLPEEQVPQINGRTDWELTESIDWDRLIQDVDQCKSEILIVEGIFVFSDEARRIPYDYLILVETDRDTFQKRRGGSHRWGKEPSWYLDHVWKSNLALILNATPDIRIDGTGDINFEEIIDKLV
ncbi:MAG: hypothetical protein RIM99_15290 [Cyclobacteriaceae bacterium]